MTILILVLHSIICVLLVIIILMQSGRGGGLTEGFAAAENMFGAQTDTFLTRTTTVFATIFFVTCLSLAILSAKKDQSLMANRGIVAEQAAILPVQEKAAPSEVAKELEENVPNVQEMPQQPLTENKL